VVDMVGTQDEADDGGNVDISWDEAGNAADVVDVVDVVDAGAAGAGADVVGGGGHVEPDRAGSRADDGLSHRHALEMAVHNSEDIGKGDSKEVEDTPPSLQTASSTRDFWRWLIIV